MIGKPPDRAGPARQRKGDQDQKPDDGKRCPKGIVFGKAPQKGQKCRHARPLFDRQQLGDIGHDHPAEIDQHPEDHRKQKDRISQATDNRSHDLSLLAQGPAVLFELAGKIVRVFAGFQHHPVIGRNPVLDRFTKGPPILHVAQHGGQEDRHRLALFLALIAGHQRQQRHRLGLGHARAQECCEFLIEPDTRLEPELCLGKIFLDLGRHQRIASFDVSSMISKRRRSTSWPSSRS